MAVSKSRHLSPLSLPGYCQKICYMSDYTAYPGAYIPPTEVNTLVQTLKLPGRATVAQPLVNIDEYDQYFKIEAVIYGVSREEILVTADENVLSVTGIRNSKEMQNRHQLQEFDPGCFNRLILLPQNTDPEYTIAEKKTLISVWQ